MDRKDKECLARLLPIEFEATSEGFQPKFVERPDQTGMSLQLRACPSDEVFGPLVDFVDELVAQSQLSSLPKLVKKAVELYKDDTLAASIVTSWVKDGWYVSVVRWRGPRNEMTRQVLFGINNADLETAYKEALRRLL